MALEDSPAIQTVDLTNCDQEPIRTPGAVQPHGALLVLRLADLTIVQASRSIADLFQVPAESILGKHIGVLLNRDDFGLLQGVVDEASLIAEPVYLLSLKGANGLRAVDGIVHAQDGMIILELEPSSHREAGGSGLLYRTVQAAIRRVDACETLAEMCNAVAREVRNVSGFDRVMVYRFDHLWNGAVAAEAKRDDLEPFLGLHYPASDIPSQARQLYETNRLRFIADRDYLPSPLVPALNPLTGRPLDMSFCVLRSVSPIHLEYLRNMGVWASMSISLMKGGKLWGLVACHHYSGARHVPFDIRTGCELISQVMSLQIAAKEDAETAAYADSMKAVRSKLTNFMEAGEDFGFGLTQRRPNLLDFIAASGAAVVHDGRIVPTGKTPSEADIWALVEWLTTQEPHEIFHTDSLTRMNAPFERMKETASGLLALSLATGRPNYVLWFRSEQVTTVDWAGDPEKSIVKGEGGVRLSPRGSFALWKQTVRFRSEIWTRAEITAAVDLRRDVVGVVLRRAERLELLHRELQSSYTQLDSVASLLSQSEERLRQATSAAGVGIWEWDLSTGRVVWTDEHYAIAGRQPGEFGETYDALETAIHPEDRARVREGLEAAVSRNASFNEEYRLVRPDKSVRWVAGRGRVFFDAYGKPLRVSGVAVDITERKAAEEERSALLTSERLARSDAERASRLKDDFLATLSHELRTPLNAIVGWTAILRAPNAPVEDLSEGLEVIERNAIVQAQLIEDLLDVSRVIAGKLRLDVKQMDLSPVIGAALDAVAPAARNKTVRINSVIDPRAAAIWGDPARIQQVLWNLLSNAIKFTPKGGRVQISLARINSHVEITVSDTGIGIAPEFLPHVFERFRQADAATTRKFGGLGLGLAIVRNLIELHGGTVHAHSEGDGKGSTFIIRLPLAAVERPDSRSAKTEGKPARRPAPAGCPDPSIEGLRVLIVDDEPDSRRLVQRILEDCGVKVTSAGSVDEAMKAVDAERFDAIVSDIGMPDRDGYDLIRSIRALPTDKGSKTPAVALTALARAEDRRHALLAGFQIHVPKPVDPSELLTVIASVAGRTGQG